MTDTAVAAKIHQPFDIHRDFTAQITLNLEVRDRGTQLGNFGLREILGRRCRINAGRRTNLLRASIANTVDRRECDHDVLVQRYVDACYTCH